MLLSRSLKNGLLQKSYAITNPHRYAHIALIFAAAQLK